ncbi:hypothetical protein DVH24_036090 [Malus domestica]|uniref:Uncharacterized protein n=1 Tax=Malus domestica TaxID=3750 RepID=A0A498IFE7_MALDO|nr:hypothetical protein DVH24_036090 [Malus domestica]
MALDATRVVPSNFSINDCFPPKRNLLKVNQQSLLQASQMVHQTRGSKPRRGGRGARSLNRSGCASCIDEGNPPELYDVVINPSKELVEAEECEPSKSSIVAGINPLASTQNGVLVQNKI